MGGSNKNKIPQKYLFFWDSVSQSLVGGHLVEGELEQQLRQILTLEVDAALCSEPAPHWWKYEEAVSNLDGKMFDGRSGTSRFLEESKL